MGETLYEGRHGLFVIHGHRKGRGALSHRVIDTAVQRGRERVAKGRSLGGKGMEKGRKRSLERLGAIGDPRGELGRADH